MNDYIFITDERKYETLFRVSAETIEDAKTKFAKNIWEFDELALEEIESKTVNMSFWEKYCLDLVSNVDGSWLHGIDKSKKLLKSNLEKDFSPEIAEKLIDYFFNEEIELDELSDKTRLDLAKVQIQKYLDENFLRIYPLDEMKSIS